MPYPSLDAARMKAAKIWICVGLIVLLLGGASLRMFSRAQYFKGIADAAAVAAEQQSAVITEIRSRTQSLTTELQQLNEIAEQHAREDSLRLRELNELQQQAESVSDSLTSELSARLDSVQQEQLNALVVSHRIEVTTLQDALEIETTGRRNEALRADRANNLVLQLEQQIGQLELRDTTRVAEITALREATASLGFSFDTSWLTGAGGVVLGYALASLLQR
jgi:hypothetical protein